MEFISGLLEKSGGHEYIPIWVKYFTKPFSVRNIENSKPTPIDNFINSFNYSPLTQQQILNSVKTIHDIETLEETLVNLFKMKEIPMLNHLFFLHSWFDSASAIQDSKFYENIEDFFVRSFICVFYNIRQIFPRVLKENRCPELPDKCWNFVSEAISILFVFETLQKSDAVILLKYFFDSIPNMQQIFLLQSGHYIRTAIERVGIIVIPLLSIENNTGIGDIVAFLAKLFHEWTFVFKRDQDLQFYSNFTSAFLNSSLEIFEQFNLKQISDIVSDTSKIIQYLLSFQAKIESYFQLMTTCFRFLTKSIVHINSNPILIAVVNDLMLLAMTQFTSYEIPILPDENDCSLLLNENIAKFSTNILSKKGCSILNQSWHLILIEMQQYVSNLNEQSAVIMHLAIQNLRISKDEAIIEKSYALLLSLCQIKQIDFSLIEEFLNLIPFTDMFPFPIGKQEKRLSEYQLAYLQFLYLYIVNNPQQQESMFNYISTLYAHPNFDRILYFIPLFRSLVLDNNTNF